MKAKFFAPALLALPLGLLAFKPSASNSESIYSLERVGYETVMDESFIQANAGIFAKSSSVTKTKESSTVQNTSVLTSFAYEKMDNLSLEQFVNKHE